MYTRIQFLAAALIAATAACATVSPVPPVDTSAIQYRASELRVDTLSSEGIAVLPLGAAKNAETVRPFAERMVTEQIQATRPKAKVLSANAVQTALQDNAAYAAYTELLDTHGQPDEVRADTLAVVGDAVGVRYLLVSFLETERSVQYNTEAIEARIYAQLWDAKSGTLVWEGIGAAAASMSTPTPGNVTPVSSAVRQAARGLAVRLGRSQQDIRRTSTVDEVHAAAQGEIAHTQATNAAQAEAAVHGAYLLLLILDAFLH